MNFGILGPEQIVSQRRQQDLGLAVAVRYYNDRAVPGLGGMWFAMPVLWSVLAVSIAEELGIPALPVGNAVEALMMPHGADVQPDRRIRGLRKMRGVEDRSFRNLCKRGTYVMQPIRMAMVQPLVALGFVRGSRYGAFRIHEAGQRMLDLPGMSDHLERLLAWAKGKEPHNLNETRAALAPTSQVPEAARKLIRAQLLFGNDDSARRRRDLASLTAGPTAQYLENPTPLPGIDHDHWADLRAGAAFMDLRDAALRVLDRLEQRLGNLPCATERPRFSIESAAEEAKDEIDLLQSLATRIGPRIIEDKEPVTSFLSEIKRDPPSLVRALAERDGTVIRWDGEHIRLGPAAAEPRTDEDIGTPYSQKGNPFAPQLFRLYNLHCLTRELESGVNPGAPSEKEPTNA